MQEGIWCTNLTEVSQAGENDFFLSPKFTKKCSMIVDRPGVCVVMAIFADFHQFSAKSWLFSQKKYIETFFLHKRVWF
jgi:hypothetical protein